MTAEPLREAYSFVCLRCGHAWEGLYELRHTVGAAGVVRTDYYVHGIKEPSPLTENSCRVCGSRTIRILRPGRVASARPQID